MGYNKVMVYREGILGWAKAGLPIDSTAQYPEVMIPIVSSTELLALNDPSTFLIDIRPESHFKKGHIQGSINIDLEDLPAKVKTLPKNRRIVLIDHKGKLTMTTGRYLFSKGFKDLMRLDGGFNAWVKNGMPID